MPRISRKTQYTKKEECCIYVILNPFSKEFYIDHTLTRNVRQLYIEHCLGNRKKTEALAFKAREDSIRLCCFNLCELFCTKVEAYRVVIAWTKIFVEQGFINVDHGNIECYIDDLFGDAKSFYESNKHIHIDQKFNCSNCLFPTFKRQECAMKARGVSSMNENI